MDRAVKILQGEQPPQGDIVNLARALKNRFKRFGMARKLLWLARGDSARVTERDTTSRWLRKLAQREAFGQRASLYQSLACYERAWSQGLEDDGYTGINAAFLLDLIAFAVES